MKTGQWSYLICRWLVEDSNLWNSNIFSSQYKSFYNWLFLASFPKEMFNNSDLGFCFPYLLSVSQSSRHFPDAILFILNLFCKAYQSLYFTVKSSRSLLAHRDENLHSYFKLLKKIAFTIRFYMRFCFYCSHCFFFIRYFHGIIFHICLLYLEQWEYMSIITKGVSNFIHMWVLLYLTCGKFFKKF